jgi:hypothetical protein
MFNQGLIIIYLDTKLKLSLAIIFSQGLLTMFNH